MMVQMGDKFVNDRREILIIGNGTYKKTYLCRWNSSITGHRLESEITLEELMENYEYKPSSKFHNHKSKLNI